MLIPSHQENAVRNILGLKPVDEEPVEEPYRPNREQRRAQQKKDRQRQRRGQKAFDRAQRERAKVAQKERVASEGTYWNGLKTLAIRGTAVVESIGGHWPGYYPEYRVQHGPNPIGQRIKVVMVDLDGVNYGGGIHYLYDEDGSGWRKVTEGRGGPAYGSQDVYIVEGTFEAAL